MTTDNLQFKVTDLRRPNYFNDMVYWQEWREVYNGGYDFVQKYLQKFTSRETDTDFNSRKSITPVQPYAKAAVNDIRNAIFQRMRDITRTGGSDNYQHAVAGEAGGVDLKGSTMNGFIGVDLLTELLVMGSVGLFVDMPQINGTTLADVGGSRPYLYLYQIEDVLAWSTAHPEAPGEFASVLLRDRGYDYIYEDVCGIEFPGNAFERYRLLWVDKETGYVKVQFYDAKGGTINSDGTPCITGPTQLDLRRIPFVLLNIGDSVLKDISRHQVALLNLASSDVAYALKANFPFFTEQRDLRAPATHLKKNVNPDGTAMAGGQSANDEEIAVGATQGRYYGKDMERPGFIHPSSEPLKASIALQEKLEDDIRKLVNLSVSNKTGKTVTSAEALKMSDQGLEAGLSYIGLVLENSERKIADYWASYEETRPPYRKVATVKYPERYSLKTDEDRIREAERFASLIFTVPGNTAKEEMAKSVVHTLFSGRVTTEVLAQMCKEIISASYATSDPKIIIQAAEAGLVGPQTASLALGFAPDEYRKAQKAHAQRAKELIEAQSSVKNAARGAPDLSLDPANEASIERTEATDTTLKSTVKKPDRGDGRFNEEE